MSWVTQMWQLYCCQNSYFGWPPHTISLINEWRIYCIWYWDGGRSSRTSISKIRVRYFKTEKLWKEFEHIVLQQEMRMIIFSTNDSYWRRQKIWLINAAFRCHLIEPSSEKQVSSWKMEQNKWSLSLCEWQFNKQIFTKQVFFFLRFGFVLCNSLRESTRNRGTMRFKVIFHCSCGWMKPVEIMRLRLVQTGLNQIFGYDVTSEHRAAREVFWRKISFDNCSLTWWFTWGVLQNQLMFTQGISQLYSSDIKHSLMSDCCCFICNKSVVPAGIQYLLVGWFTAEMNIVIQYIHCRWHKHLTCTNLHNI